MGMGLARWLSFVWPVRIWQGKGAHGDLELTWEYGHLVVNSANANQSFGSLHRVLRAAFRDARVRERAPHTALILGYGAGSAGHILRHELGLATRLIGVDQDPVMLDLARTRFPLDPADDLQLVQADAMAHVAERQDRFDLILIDLFHDLDLAPGVEMPRFLAEIRRLASPNGLVLVNTVVHDELSAARSARLRDELRLLFTDVREQRYERTNLVYIAL